MKGMKGKLLKQLKNIKPIGYLKPERILQVNAADGIFETISKISNVKFQQPQLELENKQSEQDKINERIEEPADIIDVAELMRDLEADEDEDEDEEMELDDVINDKENIGPPMKPKDSVSCNFKEHVELSKKVEPLGEIDVSSFRRPDMNSGTLFDPNLLAAFEEAVNQHIRLSQEERKSRIEQESPEKHREETDRDARIEQDDFEKIEEEPPYKARRIEKEEEEEDDSSPLLNFEHKCPPGGEESVILYTTTLRGIRKTFEDCSSIRFLLESFKVIFYERDVSMHTEFKEELWKILDCKAVPPRLFIKGRYIGGASEVLTLHEQGRFRPLFDEIPIDRSDGPCEACAGVRFVLCYRCCGSHRVVADDGLSSTCHECNENGLIICPYCC